MNKNSMGQIITMTCFGESHGPAMGVVIDGCPAGVEYDEALLLKNLARRKPGSPTQSSRQEEDQPHLLSGVFQGKTLGTPIAIMVYNKDQNSSHYTENEIHFRAGHADDLWKYKFGHFDYRGGGRASGRETLCRVIAGSIGQMILKHLAPELEVKATLTQVGTLDSSQQDFISHVEQLLLKAKKEGKSYGGIAQLTLTKVPKGLGQPLFAKFKADLASSLLSIGATYGMMLGTTQASTLEGEVFHSQIANYQGIRGGITTGEDIVVDIYFKPTSTFGEKALQGRHDPCIIPRALPVLEAMGYFILANHLLWTRLDHIDLRT